MGLARTTWTLALCSLLALSACGGEGALDEEGLYDEQGLDESDSLGQGVTASYRAGKELRTLLPLNQRKGPSTSYPVIQLVPEDAIVEVAAAGAPTKGWYNVTYKGKTGWCHGAYLQSTTDARLIKWGVYPDASDAFKRAGLTNSDIWQTIGSASASAGTHAIDGYANGNPYSAATDIHPDRFTEAQIKTLLEDLGRLGFAGWYRKPCYDGWPCGEVRHIHVIYAGSAQMKYSLQAQVRDWLAGRNGLASHLTYRFYVWSAAAKDVVRTQFTYVH